MDKRGKIIENFLKPTYAELFYLSIGFFLGAIIVFFTFYLYAKQPKEYVYIDVESVIGEILTKLKSENLPQATLEQKINQAREVFKYEIDHYANDNNSVVLSSPKAIAGAANITSLLKKRVLEQLK